MLENYDVETAQELMGYATVWTDGWLRLEDRAAMIGRLLGVHEDKNIRVPGLTATAS